MAFTRSKNRRRVDATQKKANAWELLRRNGKVATRAAWLLAFVAVLALGAKQCHRYALNSNLLSIRHIQISGLRQLTEPELLRLAGLGLGKNLLSLDVAAAQKALLSHPWIKRADVRRSFPSTLWVQVEEHVPEAMVSLGALYLVDSEGEPFKRVQAQDPGDLLLISGIERDAYVREPEKSQARMSVALQVARAYGSSPAGKSAPLSEARLEGDEVVLVLLGSGQEIRMGQGNTAEKLWRLQQAQAELVRRGLRAEVIHLDNRQRPGWVTAKISGPGSERKLGPSK